MPNIPVERMPIRVKVMFIAGIAFVALCVVIGIARAWEHEFSPDMIPPTAEEAIDIQKWIPVHCCRTNNCCFKVPASAIHPLSRDEWVVVISGQKVRRTGWSEDGQTWRCACDQMDSGGWRIHPRANTRCIFPQATGS